MEKAGPVADATSIGIGRGEILDSILHYGEEEIDVEAEEGRRGQKARADVFVQHNVLSAQRRSILPSRWQKWRHRGISLAPPISLCVFPTLPYFLDVDYVLYIRKGPERGRRVFSPFPLSAEGKMLPFPYEQAQSSFTTTSYITEEGRGKDFLFLSSPLGIESILLSSPP